MKIKILHLYYDIMNLYGEYGNVRILEQHLKDQGIEVIVDKKTIEEEKEFEKYDFIYIGCGTEKNQKVILQDIIKEKEEFINAVENGKIMLLTGNSFEILGKSIDTNEALGILDFDVKHTNFRKTADIIFTNDLLKNKIVGFINTMSVINNNKQPLFNVEWGLENTDKEGVIYKNIFGTSVIGPILQRNPEILQQLITKICTQKDENFNYKDIVYKDEEKGYKLVLNELENRRQEISVK